MSAAALVDLARYPVEDPDGAGAAVIAHHAAELRDAGVSILPGFLLEDALPGLVAECDARALAMGRAGGPTVAEVVAQRDAAWNPFFRAP